MPPDLHFRDWNEDPPNYGDNSALFSIEVCHNGFFCGLRGDLSYVSSSTGVFDNCYAGTWCMSVVDEILFMLGYQRNGKLHVYWSPSGKEITEGLVPVETNADTANMITASKTEKTLVLFIDHKNFLRELRADAILFLESTRAAPNISAGPSMPPVITPRSDAIFTIDCEASTSEVVASEKRHIDNECEDYVIEKRHSDDDSDSVSELYDSDCDAEEGDDDLFAENVDRDVNDHNEKEVCLQNEDESALEDEDLSMLDEEKELLKNKFKAFDPTIDMDNPVFRVGLVFSDVEEARKALGAYTIRNRKKIRKIKNDRRRLEAVCDEGCPWMIKIAKDTRYDGFSVTTYAGNQNCLHWL